MHVEILDPKPPKYSPNEQKNIFMATERLKLLTAEERHGLMSKARINEEREKAIKYLKNMGIRYEA